MTFARITGTGGYLPDKVLTNKDLESLVGPNANGSCRAPASRAPHRADGQYTSDLALGGSRRRSPQPGRTPPYVDLIILATSTPDMVFPSSACLLQAKLGVTRGVAFDVQAVCSGFAYALGTADLFAPPASIAARWWSVPKSSRASSDWKAPRTCALFGDGARVVLEGSHTLGTGSVSPTRTDATQHPYGAGTRVRRKIWAIPR